MMQRVAKGAGYGNVYLEDVAIPAIGSHEVLIRAHTSLISRGSEILRRYRNEGPIDPHIMGYSLAGTVAAVGEEATARGHAVGDRVYALSPHAEYVAAPTGDDGQRVRPLPPELPWDWAPFQGLACGALQWAVASRAQPGDTVVVLGQGLVGNLVMQAHRARGAGRVITVDILDMRVSLSTQLGADVAIHAGMVDPVAEVRRLTNGKGADVVVDCVGGAPGVQSFQQALQMVKDDGIIHLVGLYHGQPLPLDAGAIQRKMLIGGYHLFEPFRPLSDQTTALLASEQIQVAPLITHRFPAVQAAEAFALLDEHPDRAFGVLLEWPQEAP